MPVLPSRSSVAVPAVVVCATLLGVLAGINPRLAVLAALGLVFMVLVLEDFTLGVLVLVALAFVDALPVFSPAKLVGALLVVSWLAYIASHPDDETLLKGRPLLSSALIAFVAWIALSVAWAESRGAALTALGRYTPNALLIPIVYSALRGRRDVIRILGVIVAAAVASSALAVVQPPATGAAIGDPQRAAGAAGDANELAAALVVGLVISASFAINRGIATAARAAATISIPLCLLGILLTLSRGGLVALAVALATAVVFSGRWRGRAAALAVVVLGMAIFFLAFVASPPARDRVLEIGGGTGRIDLWTVGWRMVEAHPFEGVGAGNFPSSSVHYLLRPGIIQRDDFIITKPLAAHNTYLQVLAENGALGLALFLVIILFSLTTLALAVGAFRRQRDEVMELLGRGLFVGLVALLTAIFFISEEYSKLLWLMLGIGPALLRVARTRDALGREPRPDRVRLAAP